MRGVAEDTIWITLAFALLIIVAALIYAMFYPDECDREAELSAQEVKRAIECAANYPGYVDPNDPNGETCNEATVRLCQREASTVFGVGFMQAYYGLMTPDYLIYYEKFPKKDVTDSMRWAPFYVDWSESYPFERAYLGQRIWDFDVNIGDWGIKRPTLTRFKEYWKTKYLDEGCTDDNGLCFNVREREEVIKLNAPDVNDVRVRRRYLDPTEDGRDPLERLWDYIGLALSPVAHLKADDDPTFHLASPCYADVTFTKESGGVILAKVDKCGADGPNYCYADEKVLGHVRAAYGVEVGLYVVDFVITFFTAGTLKGAAKGGAEKGQDLTLREIADKGGTEISEKVKIKIVSESSQQAMLELGEDAGSRALYNRAAEIAIQKTSAAGGIRVSQEYVIKEVFKDSASGVAYRTSVASGVFSNLKTYGKFMARRMGIPYSKKTALAALPIPCIDLDWARGFGSCGEAYALWPGHPFTDLNADDMSSSCKSTNSAASVMAECCLNYVYGSFDNPDAMICTEPSYLVELLAPKIKHTDDEEILAEGITLTEVADYLDIDKSVVDEYCSLVKGDMSKDCLDAEEVLSKNWHREALNCYLEDWGDDLNTHTFDFGSMREITNADVLVMMYEEECESQISVEISVDGVIWEEIYRFHDVYGFPNPNRDIVEIPENTIFRYMRLREIHGAAASYCRFDYSVIVLAPYGTVIKAEEGEVYELRPFLFNYFLTPEDYNQNASVLCGSVENCVSVSRGLPISKEGEDKYYIELDGPDFEIFEKETVGIMTNASSIVVFEVD